ncbi:MAG TPA: hypothetical protein VFH56_05880 [Acidimicrobiales bacterium]|nr:hypothetical protein [Acidimicrobiales bacterium]
MRATGTMHEWYRFLDAHSDDEAVCELRRHIGRLDTVYGELEKVTRGLAYAPGGEVDEALLMAKTTLSEAIELLTGVVARFRAGEHQMA